MKQKKTVKEWLEMLPPPYREQALQNLFKRRENTEAQTVLEALFIAFDWQDTEQKDKYWRNFYNALRLGEFDKPAIPWPDEAKWENAPVWAYARASDMDGYCYFYGVVARGKEYEPALRSCGKIANMTGIDWKASLETRPK